MLNKDDFESIGYIARTHGIQGEVACKLTVDLTPLFSSEDKLFLMLEEQGLLIPYAVASLRPKGEEVDLIRFDHITTREQAEALVGSSLWLSRDYMEDDELPSDPLEFTRYVGFKLINANDSSLLGEISHVDESTMNTLLYIETPNHAEIILPIAEELLHSYDDKDRTLSLRIPQGLLEVYSQQ